MPPCTDGIVASSTASAPGKLILFGEHSVVHGYAAVAAALSHLRVTVHIEATTKDEIDATLHDLPSKASANGAPITLRASTSDLSARLDGTSANWRVPEPPSEATITNLNEALSPATAAGDRAALAPLLFLCRSMLPEIFQTSQKRKTSGERIHSARGLCISVRSADLPLGAGLGSSAAFSVALAASLLQLRLRLFGDGNADGHQTVPLTTGVSVTLHIPPAEPLSAICPGEEAKRLINGWAYAAECILHGTPSGLDNQVSCAGDAIRHVRAGQTKHFDCVPDMPALRVLITNTRVPRSTRALVAKVGALHAAQPGVTTRIFEAIGEITESFLALARPAHATNGHATAPARASTTACASSSSSAVATIGSLVQMNHHLLCALGVGHAALDQVRHAPPLCSAAVLHSPRAPTPQVVAITEEEALPTKLTGAGGGGCAFTVLGSADEALGESIVAATARAKGRLEAGGFHCFETQVGGHGALWHS